MKFKLSRESAVAVSRCVLFHHSFPSRASQKEATACPVTMAEDLLESLLSDCICSKSGGTAVELSSLRLIPRGLFVFRFTFQKHLPKDGILMKNLIITDATLRRKAEAASERGGNAYGFKAVIETAKLLERAGADIIEMAPVTDRKTDSLILRTIAAAIGAKLAVVGGTSTETIDLAWDALKGAGSARIIIALPVSAVQMEYLCHKKPDAMLAHVELLVKHAVSLCKDVEFSAVDATRSEREFLIKAISAAIDAGAGAVTVCDTAGVMMPWEFASLIEDVKAAIPSDKDISLGAETSDGLGVANACALEAVRAGCDFIKVGSVGTGLPSLLSVCNALSQKSDCMRVSVGANMTVLRKTSSQISSIWDDGRRRTDTDSEDDSSSMLLDIHSDINAIRDAAESIGYDLSEADLANVYELFRAVADKKKVSQKELEAIIASAAMQVPPTYTLDSFVINSGSIITSTAHVVLDRGGRKLEGVSLGDGPIDAAFLAIEQIVGHHFELDDFQIQSVTEGREAVGDAIVKLRSQGRLYSGRGISTDIVGASISAYVSALNKIVYEERGV